MKTVQMIQNLATPEESYTTGQLVELDDWEAMQWIKSRIARDTVDFTQERIDFQERLNVGAYQPCIFLPSPEMEFGHEINHRVRFIHFHKASLKIVCCRKFDEVLYPEADAFVYDWEDVPDHQRAGSGRYEWAWPDLRAKAAAEGITPVETGNLSLWQEYNCDVCASYGIDLTPKKRKLKADVVLGIRNRPGFCTEKNWPVENWQHVADKIMEAGFTVAVVGKRPTTHDIQGQQYHSSDYPDTDAAVELLQNCRLYVGSDTGVSHLAALCKARMLVFREEAHEYRSYIPHMRRIVGKQKLTELCNVWDEPDTIAFHALRLLDNA